MEDKTARDDLASIDLPGGINELRRLEQIMAKLSDAASLNSTLEDIVRAMAKALDTDINSIYLVDRLSNELVCGASIGLPDDYVKAVARVPIGPKVGSCGRAVYTNSVIIIEDMRADPNWADYLPFSESAALRAIWSVPFANAAGEVLGAFATYYREPHRPEQKEIELAQVYARQAAIALENARLYEQAEREHAQLQSIIEQMPEGIFIARAPDGAPILMNRAGAEITGQMSEGAKASDYDWHWSLQRMDGTPLSPDEWPMVRALRGETMREQEYGYTGPDGKFRYLLINFGPIHRDDGSIYGGTVIFRDITARKHTESEFTKLLAREQAARFEAEHVNKLRAELLVREASARAEAEAARREWQTTFDTMTDSVLLVDENDRFVRANRAYYERVGLTPEECTGRPAKDLAHEKDKKYSDRDACVICQLRMKHVRGAIEVPAGVISDYPVFASADPIVDEHGNTVGVVQVVRDLTDLYRARRAAERERTSLNAIIEQMAEGMIVCDQAGTIIRTNQQAVRLYGYDAEDIMANGAEHFVEGRFSDEAGHVVAYGDLPVPTALREQRTVDKRLWFSRPDGQRLLLSLTASPFFNEDNQVAGAILLTRDVTEQQREHERTLQADKLRALGQLASGVAHNFNNALAAVIGYTQLALPKVKDPDIAKYLRVVEQSAKDAARMVGRIQNFARSRSRKDQFIPVRLTDIIRDAIDITRPRWQNDAQALGLKYKVKLVRLPDENHVVSGEPSELRVVFVNIIFNALDAMPLGGSLSITTDLHSDDLSVRFVDTGGGMTDEIKRRIFEPFFTTKGAAGLGMGLSESYQIIERHNGRIDVESQLRRGTTITIKLPLMKAADKVIENETANLPVKRARILVIDDEEPVRNVISIILKDFGHTVFSARGGEEGLRLFDRYPFEIVFTDLAMPKVDGIAVATEIKARKPKTKVVLMSGYGTDKIYERTADNSCIDATISKPFRMPEIQETLRALLE